MASLRKRLFSEFLAVFLVVFIGCGSIRLLALHPGLYSGFWIKYFFMAAVLLGVFFVGRASGAHLNPAVSWALALVGWQAWGEAGLYSLAHFAGGGFASFLHWAFFPGTDQYGATNPVISSWQACWREALIFFILLIGILFIMTKFKSWWKFLLFSLWFWLVITLAGNYGTGLSLNPARSLGPNLFQGTYASLWVYFVGPTLGAWAAFALFKWIDPKIIAWQGRRRRARENENQTTVNSSL